MGRLRDRVFDCRELTVDTKFKVYNQCIIPLMMNEVKPGPYIVMTLRDQFSLKIRWDHFINNDVLERAKCTDIEIVLIRKRLRYVGWVMLHNTR